MNTLISTYLFKNWKTSALGLCFLGIAVFHGIHFDAAGHIAMTAKDWCGIGTGLLGSIIGCLMKDAGTVVATTPGNPDPHTEPSHEVPDKPGAKPVV